MKKNRKTQTVIKGKLGAINTRIKKGERSSYYLRRNMGMTREPSNQEDFKGKREEGVGKNDKKIGEE